ncbi:MAG TPA: hypothetical protein DEA90_12940 [Opitutae bacterium]|nr:hypothetical protein [Opitutae bacterium]
MIDLQERVKDMMIEQFQRIEELDQSLDSPSLRLSHMEIKSLRLNEEVIPQRSTLPPHQAYESGVPLFKHLHLN